MDAMDLSVPMPGTTISDVERRAKAAALAEQAYRFRRARDQPRLLEHLRNRHPLDRRNQFDLRAFGCAFERGYELRWPHPPPAISTQRERGDHVAAEFVLYVLAGGHRRARSTPARGAVWRRAATGCLLPGAGQCAETAAGG